MRQASPPATSDVLRRGGERGVSCPQHRPCGTLLFDHIPVGQDRALRSVLIPFRGHSASESARRCPPLHDEVCARGMGSHQRFIGQDLTGNALLDRPCRLCDLLNDRPHRFVGDAEVARHRPETLTLRTGTHVRPLVPRDARTVGPRRVPPEPDAAEASVPSSPHVFVLAPCEAWSGNRGARVQAHRPLRIAGVLVVTGRPRSVAPGLANDRPW